MRVRTLSPSCFPDDTLLSSSPIRMRSPWAIGTVPARWWHPLLGCPPRSYTVDLSRKQGIIFGKTQSSISSSLHSLAYNAATQGWKVFLFDAQGSQQEAATFYATMRSAGHEHIHLFPHDPYDGWQGTGRAILHRLLQVSPFREPYFQHIATIGLANVLLERPPLSSLDDLTERLCRMLPKRRVEATPFPALLAQLRGGDLPGLPLRYQALSCLLGDSMNGTWSFDDADAAYLSLSAWNRPEEARLQACLLLADLASYLTERTSEKTPVLVLINHPEQLFDLRHITALFARMQRVHGSLFLAARSSADFGQAAAPLLRNASVLLLHHSDHPLAERECLAITDTMVTPVRLATTPLDHEAFAHASQRLSSPPKASGTPSHQERRADATRDLGKIEEEPFLRPHPPLPAAWGITQQAWTEPFQAPAPPAPGRSRRHMRSALPRRPTPQHVEPPETTL